MMTRRRYFLIFCAGWVVLAAMRLVGNVASGALSEPDGFTLRTLAIIVPTVAVIWIPIAALILWIDRALSASRIAALVGAHLAAAALVVSVEPFWLATVLHLAGREQAYLGTLLARIDINALLYVVIVAADVSWLRLQALKVRELAAARLEQTLVDVQLHGLAIQLQPHFLFNALQFVAETAHIDLTAARRTLGHLRGLLQQAFALESRVEVTVAEELSFLRAYGEIQKSRFGDRFSLTINSDESALEGSIPPLLLQPLVENASRHGFAQRGSGGNIEVTVRRTRSDVLSIVVADDGVGLKTPIKEGQGLSVTRRRMARLYGSDAHLTIVRAADGRTESRLRFPLRAPRLAPPLPTVPVIDDAPAPRRDENSAITRLVARVPFGGRVAAVWLALLGLLMTGTWLGTFVWKEAMPEVFVEEKVGAPFWVLLTVVAVIAARRFSGRWALWMHAAVALALGVLHAAMGGEVLRLALHKEAGPGEFTHWALWDVLVYAAIVLLARAHDLGAWARAKMREEVTLNEEVVRATGRLARLRETQSVLLASLDDVIASPTMETLDRAVVDFADFLRIDVMAGVTE